jgi:hypothetical protein
LPALDGADAKLRIAVSVVGPQAGAGVEAEHLDAGPERAEREPPLVAGVDEQVRVDRVVAVVGGGRDDQPAVGPRPAAAVGLVARKMAEWLEPKVEAAVVQVVLPIVEREVGGPQVGAAVGVLGRPRRAVGPDHAGVAERRPGRSRS